MEINLKRYVDINIEQHKYSAESGTRDTIALFTPDTTGAEVGKVYSSLDEVPYASSTLTYAYLKVFFDNGGLKVAVYENSAYSTLTTETIQNLPIQYITVVAAIPVENKAAGYTAMKALSNSYNALTEEDTDKLLVYGINEKIIVTSINSLESIDTDKVKNFAVKYTNQLGGEMTIAAYLSKINIDEANSIFDYAFTEEQINEEALFDSDFESLQNANINVDVNINGTRNFGGNCKNSEDLVNNYTRIVMHQTLTNQLIQLLTQKIKSSTGISKIYAVIAQELEKYKTAGYLTSDKVWTDKDLVVKYNNVNYTIVHKGDAITNGYVIKVLPMSALTESDKLLKSAPPIYVVIADQYSIRRITINGDVI